MRLSSLHLPRSSFTFWTLHDYSPSRTCQFDSVGVALMIVHDSLALKDEMIESIRRKGRSIMDMVASR